MEKKVRIYTSPTCGYCTQAKEFLTQKGIDFTVFDVTSDPAALQEMKTVSGGARSVPVIVVGDEVLIGFERTAVEEALKRIG